MTKLAVCIRGDLREWDITKSLFFQTIDGLGYSEVDFFIVTYESIHTGYRDAEWFRPNFKIPLHKLDIEDDFKARNLVSFRTISNDNRTSSDVFDCIYKVNLDKRDYELVNDFRYDAVLNIRSDLVPYPGLFSITELLNRINRSYRWTMPTVQSRDCQDICFFGLSLELDMIAKIYNRTRKTHNPHIDLASHLHNTYLSEFHLNPAIRYIYRRDMINSVPLDTSENIEFMYEQSNLWWSRVKICTETPELIKFTYNQRLTDHEIMIGDIIDINTIRNFTSDKEKKHWLSQNSLTLYNKSLLQDIRMRYFCKKENTVIISSESVEVTNHILTVLDISTYVHKVRYND